ncbi:ubiquitin carboxyl-terminal hydrolase 5 isoform X1 [Coccinella septempunctata]|uniref:ubiquitin carboxyl-terminal hydrolase 5 isoform X1 n=1 Tax=Coccinella septempunctata TaxID=41139 RepID=UPI001D06C863|nr:ubiquitin carboxyl-terminal hydrolase 5 isoform X1 [Coccinella septempunctata]
MDLLQQYLNNIRIPKSGDKVYKDECVYSFDNPESDTGLYVSLFSFIGLGREYLEKYYNKTGDAVFLHIRREKSEVCCQQQGDGPEKKITRLAIGVEGGFSADPGKKYEYTDHCSIVILPSYTTIAWPNADLPEIVKQSVEAIFELPSANKLAELESLKGTWDGEARIISKHAQNLQQLANGKKIPPSGWKCEQCDKTDNLWLNLTDGSILCGRRFYDGSGGNNHAVEHYSTTGYPLAVKLGTITKEGKGDVFSYSEDDMVEDPLLVQHLAHWGINIANMEKTEKSMVELELELNQKTNEWSALTEKDGKLKPLYGPGYTGMVNMGNSCYLNSIMQVLFSIPDFAKTYYEERENLLNQFHGDPAEDFNIQMAKIGHGLLSGKYSVPPVQDSTEDANPEGICPSMFKNLVGKGHPEFSTKKQQDVQEFLLHLLTILERNTKNMDNPGECFKFQIEERYQCSDSKKVKYLTRSDVILPLMIPMDAATNKEEVASYEARKAELEAQGKHVDPNLLVRPKIKFFSCLEVFSQSEVINNFYSTAAGKVVTARKTTRLASFPDYLVIQLKKFMLREDWVPIKLDVSIEMPDEIDFAALRGNGLQDDEELLPEPDNPPPMPPMDQEVLKQLTDMGFPPESCKRAVFNTHNSGLEAATAWIMEHIADSDFADPFVPPGTESAKFNANPESLSIIMSMGFSEDHALKALKATDNNVERAMDWIFSHQSELEGSSAPSQPEFKDGNSKYKLVAFISHMGTSTMVGHYVVHILKDGCWVIFNDEKVALSENPPKDLGYMYFYKRI